MPSIRGFKSKKKTRRHTRDLDQLHKDLADPKHLAEYHELYNPPSEELPGLGQFYCVECSIWFPCIRDQEAHTKSKRHKRRVRALQEEPYTQKTAENAIGVSIDNGRGAEPIVIAQAGSAVKPISNTMEV